jgi:proline dehydrogenase
VKLQQAISTNGINGSVSVKLTQIGLLIDENVAIERVEELASRATRFNQLLWIDMESSEFTTKTFEIYEKALKSQKNVGVALQSYLRRSEHDLLQLVKDGGRIRLVKGAYREPHDLVFQSREEISLNYSKLMRILFEKSNHFTIATHDLNLILEAERLANAGQFEFDFAMLRGIRDDLKLKLVKSGYRVVEYIPYGKEWYPYSVRRIKEHPSNIWLLLRSLL